MKILRGAFIIPALLILSLLFVWQACSKNQKSETCTSCRSKPPEQVKSVKIVDQDFSIGIFKATKYPNLILAKVQHESKSVNQKMTDMILAMNSDRYLDKLLKRGYQPVNYNIYAQVNVKSTATINAADIVAVGVVLYYEKGLHHYLFAKTDNNGLAVDQRFTAVTDHLNLEDKYLVFDKLMTNRTGEISLITMVSPAYMDIKDDVITAQRLKYKMLRPVSTDARAIPVTSFGDGDRCDPNVCAPIQDQKGKCVEVIGGYGCKEERDDACGARAVARESNRDVDFAVKDDALYSMKWYVLEESTNGRSIVDKYYQAGITIRNNITRIDVVKAYGFITTMESKVRKIMADTESKDILFDSITRDEAIAFLDEIKNLDGSRLWSENVAWLRGLLTKYANKSVKEVFVYLNS